MRSDIWARAWDTRPPELADETEDDAAIPVRRPAAESIESGKGRARLWLRVAVGAVLGVLGASALFVFTAEGVLIEIEPAEAEVEVEAALPTPHLGSRYLLWKGEYRVRAERERYHPLDETIEVLGTGNEEFRFAMQLLPGRVVVEAVEGAEIRIEGIEGVFAPGEEISLDPGTYALAVSAPRYQDLNTALSVKGGGDREPFSAELQPDWAEITASSEPDGAELRLEGNVLGTTPATLELLSGERVLAFSKPGYATHREELIVVAGSPQLLPTIRLRPAAGVLRVRTEPPGASITVDGNFRGATPATVEVSPDRAHRVAVARAGYEPQERTVRLGRGAEQTLNITLEPRLGTVRVASRPAGAEVLVNGRGRWPDSAGTAAARNRAATGIPARRLCLAIARGGAAARVSAGIGGCPADAAATDAGPAAHRDRDLAGRGHGPGLARGVRDGLATRLAGMAKQRGAPQDTDHQALLPGRERGHEPRIQGVGAHAHLWRGTFSRPGQRNQPGGERRLANGRVFLQLA